MRIEGSICALATPFQDDGSLDMAAWDRILDWHVAAQTDGIVVGGSTGESGALEHDELEALIEAAVRRAGGAMTVIAGCGASSTRRAMELQKLARAAGAHATLVVTPAYVRPTQAGLLAHYHALADEGDLPLILYNVPSRTGCDLVPETVEELVAHPGIVGIKEARAEPERMQALLAFQSPEFAVLSGDDPTAARAMLAGADGVVSVLGNVCPRSFRALCEVARSGDNTQARLMDRSLARVNDLLGSEPNPIPVKWLMHGLGLCGPALRLPLLPLTAPWHEEAGRCVALIRNLERSAAESPPAALV